MAYDFHKLCLIVFEVYQTYTSRCCIPAGSVVEKVTALKARDEGHKGSIHFPRTVERMDHDNKAQSGSKSPRREQIQSAAGSLSSPIMAIYCGDLCTELLARTNELGHLLGGHL